MSEAGAPAVDPIHQFHIKVLQPFDIFGVDASFTNSALFMAIGALAVFFIMLIGTSGRKIVPTRLQATAEMAYEFVADMVRSVCGESGMKFFPLVFSLFMFVLACNLIGLWPYTYEVMAQIIITAGLAFSIILLTILYGIYKHGFHWFGLFKPSGVMPALLPFIIVIEILSFISRPVSLSVRLFANMLAGHIMLVVFGGFCVMLLGAGYSYLAPLPLLGITVLTAFELLVSVLQAYVFAVLTCVYINDALHPGH
ncbi:ATP synthase F0 subcomplex A subunit [Rhodoblastus acidophilus]|uniref:ATP synthase subunit a n=1 Tax=Rhodoblastus acidophilus TaxID=1074 RepID=A0A212QMB6_RHOAC|nr:F0F1 ATP synthase subunit A [Rhodoblastus acidophilus]MCW2317748.1 F-type H+-transporting ATPase subunit a [Rhodoblastus acidophilus]PPQ36206.1 F0F1 ATP synthase subunit A [Rhodoblastus acidophilus]RAI17181.1 F0F1 ATP synthase subunit A [Rhodoblastus acidophilus]SNB60519.1 ATP synthase F0 subcomplex A subunit [Rhodoblastus acidophilus]